MVSISKKVFGFASIATVFAGMAFGQATNCTPSSQTNIIRAEGTTELVAQLNITCTSTAAIATAGSATVQVFLSPALPVTGKVLSTTTGATEAAITVNGGAITSGTVSGSTISFSGVVLPAVLVANCGANFCYTFQVSNVRVNATSLSVGSGVPPAISETAFISGSAANIVPSALASTQVSFAQNGLGAAAIYKVWTPSAAASFPQGVGSTSGANNFVICNPYSPRIDAINLATTAAAAGRSMAFAVRVAENFASAFKSTAGEQSQVVNGSNAVVTGTRFQVNFANVPTGVTLYVPAAPILSTNGSGAVAQLNGAAAATAFAAVTTSTSTSITTGTGMASGVAGGNGLAAVTTTNGAGTAVFEILAGDANNLDRFDIPVFILTTSNTVPGSATAITASVNLNPTGTTGIANFTVGGSTNTLTASVFNTCSTSLLFPFVTNQLGFDTGIAISNTSTDPFGTNGATAQAGTCSLNFYGSGAPSPANVTTPNVPTGTVYTQVLSGVAAGFQGYVIAQCNFQFAHGFAFITNGVGVNGGLSQGYLAGVIPDVNQVARLANPLAVAPAGSGESVGN